MNSRDPPSKILLIIITYLPPTFPLTNDYLHELFCPYGEIKKILIFERGKANKCFVEFYDVKHSIAARNGLLGKSLISNGGKMQIHFSRLKNLDLEVVDKSRGSDYTRQKGAQDDFYCSKPAAQRHQHQSRGFQQSDNQIISHSKTDDPNLLSKQLQQINMNDFQELSKDSEDDQHNEDLPEEGIRRSVESFLDSDFQEEKKKNNLRAQPNFTLNNLEQQQQKLMQQIFMSQYGVMSPFNTQLPQLSTDPNVLQQQTQLFQQLYMQQLLMKQTALLAEQQAQAQPPQSSSNHSSKIRNSEIDNLLDDDEEEDTSPPKSVKESIKDDTSHKSKQSWRNQNTRQTTSEDQSYTKYVKNADIHAILTQKPSKTLLLKGLEGSNVNGQAIYNLFSRFGNVDYIVYQSSKKRAFVTLQNVEQATLVKEMLNNQSVFNSQLRIIFYNEEMTVNPNLDEVITYSKDNYRVHDLNSIQRPSKFLEVTGISMTKFNLIVEECKSEFALQVTRLEPLRVQITAPTLSQVLEFVSRVGPLQADQIEFRFI